MGALVGLTAEDVRRKVSLLAQFCNEFMRPIASLLITHSALPVIIAKTRERADEKLNALPERVRQRFRSTRIIGTPDEVARAYQALVDLGLNYFVAWILANDVETLELLGARVIPRLRLARAAETGGPASAQARV